MYQNGYLHSNPSRFSAKSAIYTAAGCRHIIAVCTAAVPDANSVINMAAVCPHKIAIYTAAVQEPNRLYTRQPGVSIKLLYTRQPFQSKFRYIHGGRSRAKSAIYTAVVCPYKMIIYSAVIQS